MEIISFTDDNEVVTDKGVFKVSEVVNDVIAGFIDLQTQLKAKDKEIEWLLRLVLRQKDTMHTVYSMVSNEIHHANIELNGGMIPKCSDCDYLECDHYDADKDACKQVRLKALNKKAESSD